MAFGNGLLLPTGLVLPTLPAILDALRTIGSFLVTLKRCQSWLETDPMRRRTRY